MNINGINRIAASSGSLDSSNKRAQSAKESKADRVQISEEARTRQSIDDLATKVKKYLDRIPDIRESKVEEISSKLKQGYTLNEDQLSIIADRIKSQIQKIS